MIGPTQVERQVPGYSKPGIQYGLTLRAHTIGAAELRLNEAATRRRWMDETDSGFANRCLPMLIANQWGWFILSDRAIRLNWNGGNRLQDLQIQHRKKSADEQMTLAGLLAESHFGHGILTWRVPLLFETPPGWNGYAYVLGNPASVTDALGLSAPPSSMTPCQQCTWVKDQADWICEHGHEPPLSWICKGVTAYEFDKCQEKWCGDGGVSGF